MIYSLAENKGLGILVWHDANEDDGPRSVGGLPGVGRVLRFAAELCHNGLITNDEPRLQVLTLDEGVGKHVQWREAFGGRSINMVDNWWMRPPDPRLGRERPWGYPAGLVSTWKDSSWVYVDSVSAAANGFFGYHGEGGAIFTTTEGLRLPSSLLMVTPVAPGSRAVVSFWASADTFEVADGGLDSLAAATFDVEVVFFEENPDPSDTTASWLTGAGRGALQTIVPGGGSAGAISLRASRDAGAGGTGRFASAKLWGAFHSRDAWRIARRAEHRAIGNWWHDGDTVRRAPEESMRWREFYGFVDVPPSARLARWCLVPVGFGAATATDTIGVTGFEVNCTIR
jgi:hypothetical protein